MKFLKCIMRKRDNEPAESPPAMSIEALQRDLDHSGLKNSLRDPESAWGERVAQRPADDDARETLPASNDDPLTGGDHPVDSDHRSVSVISTGKTSWETRATRNCEKPLMR